MGNFPGYKMDDVVPHRGKILFFVFSVGVIFAHAELQSCWGKVVGPAVNSHRRRIHLYHIHHHRNFVVRSDRRRE
jgi:hypothetical protein